MFLSRRKFLGAASATAVAAVVPVDAPVAAAVEVVPAAPAPVLPTWLPCDGRELPISEFKKLYDMIGMNYGGDVHRQTFKLPDLRAMSVISGNSDCPNVVSGRLMDVIETGEGDLPAGSLMMRFVKDA